MKRKLKLILPEKTSEELLDLLRIQRERERGEKGDKGEKGNKGDRGEKGEKGRDGRDGKDGVNGIDGKDGKNGIDGKDGHIKDLAPQEIRDLLELLSDEERLDASAIKNLPQLIEKTKETNFGHVIRDIYAGTNVTIDWTDPNRPTINATGGGGAVDSVNGETGVVVLTTGDIAEDTNANYVSDAQLVVLGNTSGTNTGDQNTFSTVAVSGQSNVVADSTTDTLTLVAGTNVTITTDAATDTVTINASGGGGGSTTKGIAEVDFGAVTQQSDIATVTVADASITSTSYPSVTMYAIATTDHDSDDYMVEELSAYVSSVTNGVGFDISVRAPNLSWGKYKVTYMY